MLRCSPGSRRSTDREDDLSTPTERPRDGLGRPLPSGADPSLAVPGVPVRVDLTSEDAWAAALAYLEAGQPFHAHEVLEQRWRLAPPDERAAWRALAQWGAALTHEARGNPVGASSLAARALSTLGDLPTIPACVDADLVRTSCDRLARGRD